jgi:hypothetical protein
MAADSKGVICCKLGQFGAVPVRVGSRGLTPRRSGQGTERRPFWFEMLMLPPTPLVVRIILKGKGLQKGMLEVVENKGAICDWIAQGCA